MRPPTKEGDLKARGLFESNGLQNVTFVLILKAPGARLTPSRQRLARANEVIKIRLLCRAVLGLLLAHRVIPLRSSNSVAFGAWLTLCAAFTGLDS